MSEVKTKKVKKEKSKVQVWIENIIQVVIVVACLVFSIVVISNPGGVGTEDYSKINISAMPVLSNSMSGTFEEGDLIFGEKIERDKDGNVKEILDIGEVAIFIVNDGKISEYQVINTHRVVGYYYEYSDDNDKIYYGFKDLFDKKEVVDYASAENYAKNVMEWKRFKVIGYVTSGDNKNIYYNNGNVQEGLINPNNDELIDDYVPKLNQVVGTWNGKKLNGVGGVITWMQQPTNFFFVIIVPLILLFGYNVWIIISYVIEVKTAKARKLALEEAKAGGLSKEDEEEIKRKAVEEYLKKLEEEKKDKKE